MSLPLFISEVILCYIISSFSLLVGQRLKNDFLMQLKSDSLPNNECSGFVSSDTPTCGAQRSSEDSQSSCEGGQRSPCGPLNEPGQSSHGEHSAEQVCAEEREGGEKNKKLSQREASLEKQDTLTKEDPTAEEEKVEEELSVER